MRAFTLFTAGAIALSTIAGCGDNIEPAGSADAGVGSPDGAARSSSKDLTAWSLAAADNPAMTADIPGAIADTQVAATVPFGTSISALVAKFSTDGASVTVGGVPQVSDVTPNDFREPVTYVVTAQDGSTKSYTVTVSIAESSADAITAFGFTLSLNPLLSVDVAGTITGDSIACGLPQGVDVSALVPTFVTTGASVSVGSAAQISGVTAADFSSALAYVVTAADGAQQTYQVSVSLAVCGNSVVEAGETCDDGNLVSNDGCSAVCQIERCGDGIIQLGRGETCDDGNTVDGDGCDSTCHTEPFHTTTPVKISSTAACNTGVANAAHKVAVDGSGVIYAALQCGTGASVAVSTTRGDSFGSAVDITGDLLLPALTVAQVDVASGPHDVAYVAIMLTTGDVYLRKTIDGGATWGAAALIGTASSTSAGLALETFNNDVYVGYAVAGGVDVARNHHAGAGAFDTTFVSMTVSFFDLLYDPAKDILTVSADTPTFHIRVSTDEGVTFGDEVDPPGEEFYSDWALGNGQIFCSGINLFGGDANEVFIIPTSAPATSSAIAGLPVVTGAQTRSITADVSGDAFVSSQLDLGGVQLDRLGFGSASFDTSRTISVTGSEPNSSPLPDSTGVGMEYTDGLSVFFTVQEYTND